jgi:ADP-ribose pyrophosphatase YjhB (NUDIX family)
MVPVIYECMKDTNNRVRAVIRHRDKILCFRANSNNKHYDSTKFFLPGGHIHDDECSYEAIIRELKEEIVGLSTVDACAILGVIELKWIDEIGDSHIEINFIYEVKVSFNDSIQAVSAADNYLNAEWIKEEDIKNGKVLLLPKEIGSNLDSWQSIAKEMRNQIVFSSGFDSHKKDS